MSGARGGVRLVVRGGCAGERRVGMSWLLGRCGGLLHGDVGRERGGTN